MRTLLRKICKKRYGQIIFFLGVAFLFYLSIFLFLLVISISLDFPGWVNQNIPFWNLKNEVVETENCNDIIAEIRSRIRVIEDGSTYSLWIGNDENLKFIKAYPFEAGFLSLSCKSDKKNDDSCVFYIEMEYFDRKFIGKQESFSKYPDHLKFYLAKSCSTYDKTGVSIEYYYNIIDTFIFEDRKLSKAFYTNFQLFQRNVKYPIVNRVRIEDNVKRTFSLSEG